MSVVEDDDFLLGLIGLGSERGKLLVAPVDKIIKAGPNLVLAFRLIGIVFECLLILMRIEITGVKDKDFGVVLDFLQDKLFNVFDQLIVYRNNMIAIGDGYIHKFLLHYFLCVLHYN